MGRKDKLECVSYIDLGDRVVEFSSLDSRTKAEYTARMAANFGRAVGSYLSAHPEEAKRLLKQEEGKLAET